ncbi:mismatch-specific DNA-glycosylase [Fulvivirga lutimaris]|uniref:mismatch-specific DNA-glycosylase n=1 Tax=Fulvivirga lutimaris TaxID=1819566 RepID=UPI0012BD423B|nr:mismatch-specific DNA-glycosylase [Fulvivirga lutimaris]MTI38276.1 mismatch-specific DNA-glycosylase [Fulvivirga lutimaris]
MLKDVLTYNLDVVFCGTAKGKASALKGFYYAGPGNKFYDILHKTGLTPHKLRPNECYDINQYNIGLTDLVHSEYGNDNQIKDESYDVVSFKSKILKFKPKIVAFNSKKGASFVLGYRGVTSLVEYGLQDATIGNSKLFVLPSTSGSARRYWDDSFWFQLKSVL